MPFIIWGSRGINSTLGDGVFYCPQCDNEEDYTLKQVRPFFTLYFIPIFPIGSGERYVECRGCSGTFKEEVLELEPPSESQRLVQSLHRGLVGGKSIQEVQKKLTQEGMGAADAEDIIDRLCDGQRRDCDCGESYHPEVKRCSHCGRKL